MPLRLPIKLLSKQILAGLRLSAFVNSASFCKTPGPAAQAHDSAPAAQRPERDSLPASGEPAPAALAPPKRLWLGSGNENISVACISEESCHHALQKSALRLSPHLYQPGDAMLGAGHCSPHLALSHLQRPVAECHRQVGSCPSSMSPASRASFPRHSKSG